MSFAKAQSIDGLSKAMTYEETGSKQINGKKATIKVAEKLGTHSLAWIVVKRHKVVILSIGNIVLVLNYVFPQWFELVKGLLTR